MLARANDIRQFGARKVLGKAAKAAIFSTTARR
jgi:hypothetical protein